MKQITREKFKNKKVLIYLMEFIVVIGCLITFFVLLTPKERITKDAHSYSRPEEVSRYVIVDEYMTRIRPLTKYSDFKEIAEKTLNCEIKVYSDAEKTSEVKEGYIASGMIVETEGTEDVEDAVDYKTNVIGDMTKNGDCSVAELTQIIRQIVGLTSLDEEQLLSADFNGDNQINVTDVSMCINYIVYGELEADKVLTLEKPEIRITAEGNENWYNSDVDIKIVSNDTNAINTTTTIESKIEGQGNEIETTQELDIKLTENGNYKISSQNIGADNIKSEIEVKIIKIDKTLPEIEIQKTLNNNNTYKIDINASDNNSIVKYKKQKNDEEEQVVNIEEEQEIEESVVISENGNYKFTVEDIAGNSVTKEVEITDLKNNYTVRFLDDDETEISVNTYIEGEEIQIPENPVKEEDETYIYEFSRWDKEIEETATKNIDYVAVYNKTSKDYTITFLNEDGTEVIEEKTFKSTDKAIEEPEVPEKEGYIGLWEEYSLKPENIRVKAYYVEKLENETETQATDENGITWKFTYQDGKAINVRYEEGDLGTTVEIPSRLNGYPVEEISNYNGSNIFSKDSWNSNETVENVIIPSSLKKIGDGAFRNCDKIEKIEIPEGVSTINSQSFSDMDSLKEVKIPSSITELGDNIFNWCQNLEKVELEEGIKTISSGMFYYCNSLKNINLPNSIEKIESTAFYGCNNLTNIEIGENVNEIYRAFDYCQNLESINVSENNETYTSEDGILYNKAKTELIKYPEGKKEKTYKIKNSVEKIGDSAFYHCENLTNIEIPNSVTIIGRSAFNDCRNLTSIEIPNGITNVGEYTFQDCTSLTEIEIPDSVTSIGYNAFQNCSNLTKIKIPNSVTSIGSSAFNNCRNLTSIEIPNSVTYIGYNAFSYCSELKNVKLPNSITSIESSCFSGCYKLTNIEIPTSVTQIRQNAFQRCRSLSTITIPSSVTSMDYSVFSDCDNLSDIYVDKIESEVEGFSGGWKNNCNAYVHYKDCMHTITADIEDDNINILSISNNLEEDKINCGENYQFKLVDNNNEVITDKLVVVRTQGNFTYSGEYEVVLKPDENNIYTIKNVNRNKIIKVKGQDYIQNDMKLLSTDDNGITWEYTYKDEKAEDVHYKFGTLGEIVNIPSDLSGYGVVSIYNDSYRNIFVDSDNNENSIVKEINVPEGVELIEEYAFYRCTNLTNINIASSIKTIEYNAFSDCEKLENLDIPNGVIELEDRAFYGCTNLKNVTIASSIEKIGDDVFSRCYSMSNIYVDNLKENIELGYEWNPYGYTHFKDCMHEITYEKHTNMYSEIEDVSNNTENGKINCLDTYKFKLLNKKGRAITSEKVLVEFIGLDKEEEKDYERTRRIVDNGGDLFADEEEGIIEIKPNEEGIYTIENIHRDIKIVIEQYESTDENGITWNYSYENGKATNVHYISGDLEEIVEIPDTLDGYPVVSLSNKQNVGSIFENAEENREKIKTIQIPNSVTEIGNYAFHKLSNATDIEIPKNVTSIGYAAFYGCENLQQIEIPDTVTTIKGWAFAGCTNFKDIVIPETVTDMGEAVFSRCGSLESIELLANIDKVEKYTFIDCGKLTNITLSNTISTIEEMAFVGCGSLVNLNIPSNIEKIGQNAFRGCGNVKEINIPDSVIEIGDDAFSYCGSIEEVNIPSSVRKLGMIFNSCYNLKDVYVDNLKEYVTITTYNGYLWNYGPRAYIHFKDSEYSISSKDYSKLNLKVQACTDIGIDGKVLLNETYKFKILDEDENRITNQNVKIVELGLTKQYNTETEIYPDEEGIYTIENIRRNVMIVIGGKYSRATDENGITWEYTCEDGKATNVYYISGELEEELIIPETLDEYPVVSLYNEAKIESYNIFGKYQYEQFDVIKKIKLPDSIETIGDYAFAGCYGLESIEIQNNVTSIGKRAFYRCNNLKEIEIPDSVTDIGEYCFTECYELEKVMLPVRLKKIENRMFEYCYNLKDVNIPDEVEIIGEESFYNCNQLTSIVLPDALKIIGNRAFGSCHNLENFEVSDSLLEIGNGAFESTAYYNRQENGVWYIGKVAMGYKGNMPKKTNIVIKEGTKAIASAAFSGKSELKSIELPDSIVRIGNEAFRGCNLLESIELPKGIEYIGEAAFSDCTKLKTIVIWDTIGGVGSRAFRGWRKDQEIDIELQEISEGWDKDWKEDCEAEVVFAYTGE